MKSGIYIFTNKFNGKKYVGQSVDCYRRFLEHRRSAYPEQYASRGERDSNTPIHLAFQKYGFDNFDYEIIEECPKENLNERERYWINYYDSTNKEKGYNISIGGQDMVGAKGEYHSQAKLSQAEVDEIKKLLKYSDLSLLEIQEQFPNVGKSMISLINTGKNWKNNDEEYPLRKQFKIQKGEKVSNALFTNDQVLEMRKLHGTGTKPKDICAMYPKISENTIKAILYGKSYKYLPLWNKEKNDWN